MGYLLRLVILIILAWVAYRFVRRLLNADTESSPTENLEKIEMVPCEKCGVHIPKQEALMRDGKAYCSAAHLEADKE